MNTNVRVIEAIQCITAIGLDMAKAADCIEDLEQSVSYWKNSAREFERRLEASERVCANEADLRTTLEVKYEAVVTANESLRNKVAEAIQVKEKVLQELSDDHKAFDEERLGLTARITELETKLSEALTANWAEVVVPKLPEPKKLSKQLAPEPEVVEEVPIVQDENLKRDYYFYIESMPMPGTTITSIQEIKEVRYTRNKDNRGYFSYHEAPNTARNNKFGDLVEMYPPAAYHISLLDNDEQAKYNLAKAKYTALNSSQPAFALTANETDNG